MGESLTYLLALFLQEVVSLHIELHLVVEDGQHHGGQGVDVLERLLTSGHLKHQQSQEHVVKLIEDNEIHSSQLYLIRSIAPIITRD